MDYSRIIFVVGLILVICIFHCTDTTKRKFVKTRNQKSLALPKKSSLRTAHRAPVVKLKKKPHLATLKKKPQVANIKKMTLSKKKNDIQTHKKRGTMLIRKQNHRTRNYVKRIHRAKPQKIPKKPHPRTKTRPKPKTKPTNRKGSSRTINKRCSKLKPGQAGYTACKRRYLKTQRKISGSKPNLSYQRDQSYQDPKENEVIQEEYVQLWSYNGKKCIHGYTPKSRAERKQFIYESEEDCKNKTSNIIKPQISDKLVTVYQYSPNANVCKAVETNRIAKYQYTDYQTCYDKNIQIYYDGATRLCTKWHIGMKEAYLKKFDSMAECNAQKTKRFKNYHMYDWSIEKCSLTMMWRERARYSSWDECKTYKGKVFFVYDHTAKKCLRTVDSRAFPNKVLCEIANKKKIEKKLPYSADETAYIYDPEDNLCVEVIASQTDEPRKYETEQDCSRYHFGMNQLPTKFPMEPAMNFAAITRQPPTPIACVGKTFDCGNGTCISVNRFCDGQIDCKSGIDELICKKNK